MPPFQAIGIIAKRDAQVRDTLETLLRVLDASGVRVVPDAGCAALMPERLVAVDDRALRECDLVIVIGGDGTLLNAGRTLAPHGVPILGINLGRLGFMVDVAPSETEQALREVFDGRYFEERRLMLDARIERGGKAIQHLRAVNDIVIRNQAAIRMIEFETMLDDAFISLHRADGMIVATPTGSTAYALSGGGPVIHPRVDAVTLVPICPHALSDRPLVVSARSTIALKLIGTPKARALCTADGQQHYDLDADDIVVIEAAPEPLRLIHPPSYNYFQILRTKLHWGRDRV